MYIETEVFINKVYYPKNNTLPEFTIQVDEPVYVTMITEISLIGKYSKKMKILSNISNVGNRSIIVDKYYLIICLSSRFVVYDLKKEQIIINNHLGTWAEDCVKLGSGYFVHGELDNFYFDENFDLKWKHSCGDIFENTKVKDVVEVGKKYVAVYDWFGYKHYYSPTGEYEVVKLKHLSMEK